MARLWYRFLCFLTLHCGHIEHETDALGRVWVGLRCVRCGGFHYRIRSRIDEEPAARALQESDNG